MKKIRCAALGLGILFFFPCIGGMNRCIVEQSAIWRNGTTNNVTGNKKAIVIGASSGMGREVAKRLGREGYDVGLVARRIDLLKSLQEEIPTHSYISQIDVTHPNARKQLADLIEQMGGIDLAVIGIAAYLDNRKSNDPNSYATSNNWTEKERTLNVDAKGFIAMADVFLDHFKRKKQGHLVGISSTSGQRGSAMSPVYSAAKACISCYMEAERNYMVQNNIDVQISDVVAGWVAVEHSPLGEDPSAYWEITVQEAGQVIVDGIKSQDKVIYVPKKVLLVACLLKYLPDYIYNRYLNWI